MSWTLPSDWAPEDRTSILASPEDTNSWAWETDFAPRSCRPCLTACIMNGTDPLHALMTYMPFQIFRCKNSYSLHSAFKRYPRLEVRLSLNVRWKHSKRLCSLEGFISGMQAMCLVCQNVTSGPKLNSTIVFEGKLYFTVLKILKWLKGLCCMWVTHGMCVISNCHATWLKSATLALPWPPHCRLKVAEDSWRDVAYGAAPDGAFVPDSTTHSLCNL